MSDDLDRRAALAMGWTASGYVLCGVKIEYWDGDPKERGVGYFNPSTDRNDLAELLQEVEKRGHHKTVILHFRLDGIWREDIEAMRRSAFTAWLLTADPAIICAAAVEVLENG